MQDNTTDQHNISDCHNISNAVSENGDSNIVNNEGIMYNNCKIDNSIKILLSNMFNSKKKDSIKNMDNRTGLKRKVGKRLKLYAYTIGKYSNEIFNDGNGLYFYLYTVVNIHYENIYLCDHLNIKIPVDIFKDSLDGKLVVFKGVVEEYANDKQSLVVDDIYVVSNGEIRINNLIPKMEPLYYNSNNHLKEVIDLYKNLPDHKKMLILKDSIRVVNQYLEGVLPSNFITNYIFTQYTINNSPDAIFKNDYSLIILSEKSISELTMISYALIYNLISNNIKTIKELFSYINGCLNLFQGVTHNMVGQKINSRKDLGKVITKKFMNFCDELNLKHFSSFRFIKYRNNNFGYRIEDNTTLILQALSILYSDDYDIYDDYMTGL